MKRFIKAAATAGVGLVMGLGAASAQERVDAHKDWAVFEAGGGGKKVCWIVSQPTKSVITEGGKPVDALRGDIFLMVAVRPADKVKNEVSFLAGYPFKAKSKVRVDVNGKKRADLFTDGENAWTLSPKDDDALASAFRRGSTAVLKGTSSKGKDTTDTFSLSGFTAALKAATNRCK